MPLLARSVLDQAADVLDAPDGDSRAEFDRLGEAAILDPRPPGRLADGNRATRRDDRGKAKKPGIRQFGKVFHGPHPSVEDGIGTSTSSGVLQPKTAKNLMGEVFALCHVLVNLRNSFSH